MAVELLRGKTRAGLYWRLSVAVIVVLAAVLVPLELGGSPGPGSHLGFSGALTIPHGVDYDLGRGAFSPDGTLLAGYGNPAGADNTNTLVVWRVSAAGYLRTFKAPGVYPNFLEAFAFSADDKKITTVDQAGAVHQWDLATGQQTALRPGFLAPTNAPPDIALSGDGSTVAIAHGDGADLWNLATGKLIAQFSDPDKARIPDTGNSLSLDADGGRLTIGDPAGRVYVWDVPSGKVIETLSYDAAAASGNGDAAASLSPDGKTVVLPDDADGGFNSLWSVATGSNVTPKAPEWGEPSRVVFSGDSQVVAAQNSTGKTVTIWIARTGNLPFIYHYRDANATLIALSRDGRKLVVTQANATGGASIKTDVVSIPLTGPT